MSRILVSIGAAVGLRNGVTRLPNTQKDMRTISDLLDRIGVSDGGTREIPGVWGPDRDAWITELYGCTTFQTVQNFDNPDGAVDPRGRTLGLMNQIADDPPLVATVVPTPTGYDDAIDASYDFADPASVPGTRNLRRVSKPAAFNRRLVRVEGSTIKWFGVAMSTSVASMDDIASPHVFFTPTPWQGGYQNPGYDTFGSWGKLWNDYTDGVGGPIAAAGVSQVLVIPFYKNGQENDLGGGFLLDWKDVISAVVTAAVDNIDATMLRSSYTFDTLVSSSFSNGYVAHKTFNSRGDGVSDATQVIFDLDGQAGGSTWRPSNGIIYLNRAPGRVGNPVGNLFFVGGRWAEFMPIYTPVNTHSYCADFLLFHGLQLAC
jgi:hypothetical protein